MNNLDKQTANDVTRVFDFKGAKVRTIVKDSEPLFVVKDVCDVLNHSNHKVAVSRLDKDEVSKVYLADALGRNQRTTVVNEYGLYSLILTSNKPEAKEFKRWVTHEVIPAIRKHGGYLTEQKIEEALFNPDVLIRLATSLKEEREKRKQAELEVDMKKAVIREQVPKVDSFHRFLDAYGFMDMNTFAKMVGIGRNKIFAHLRELGILMSNNQPYQRYMKYFKVINVVKRNFAYQKTFINHKGCHYLKERLRKEKII